MASKSNSSSSAKVVSSSTTPSYDYYSLPPLPPQLDHIDVSFIPLKPPSDIQMYQGPYSQQYQSMFNEPTPCPFSSSSSASSASSLPVFHMEGRTKEDFQNEYYNQNLNLVSGGGALEDWSSFNNNDTTTMMGPNATVNVMGYNGDGGVGLETVGYNGVELQEQLYGDDGGSSDLAMEARTTIRRITGQRRSSSGSEAHLTNCRDSSSKSTLTSVSQSLSRHVPFSPYALDFRLFPSLKSSGLRFLFQKELTNSDVTSVGRIVLPKKEVEEKFPLLALKEGIQLTIRDLNLPYSWRMRYRYWPNNKSRMYVLENTGDYIKCHKLRCGDFIAFYQDNNKQLYINYNRIEKAPQHAPSSSSRRPSPLQDNVQIEAPMGSILHGVHRGGGVEVAPPDNANMGGNVGCSWSRG